MKKILAMALATLVLAGTLASCASSGDPNAIDDYTPENLTAETETGTFTYARAEGDTVVLAKYESKLTHDEEVAVPATVVLEGTERRVVGIAKEAFYGLSAISKVTIASSVTSIGDYAFAGCVYLEEVVFEKGSQLLSLGTMAFQGCTGLQKMDLSDTRLTAVSEKCFESCVALTEVSLPDGMVSIADAAFGRCSALTVATLPASVTSMGDMVFFGCTALQSLVLSDNLTQMGQEALLLTGDTTLADKVDLSNLSVGSYARNYVELLLADENETAKDPAENGADENA